MWCIVVTVSLYYLEKFSRVVPRRRPGHEPSIILGALSASINPRGVRRTPLCLADISRILFLRTVRLPGITRLASIAITRTPTPLLSVETSSHSSLSLSLSLALSLSLSLPWYSRCYLFVFLPSYTAFLHLHRNSSYKPPLSSLSSSTLHSLWFLDELFFLFSEDYLETSIHFFIFWRNWMVDRLIVGSEEFR